MRWAVLFGLLVAFPVNCRYEEERPEALARVVAGKLRVQRSVGMYTTDVPGEGGAIFNERVDSLLRQYLAPYLKEAPRYMLRVVAIDYVTPERLGKPLTYSLTLEARLVDLDGKCAWPGIAKAEFVRSGSQSEQEVQQILAQRACADLAKAVPVERLEFESTP
jgi:hypothetical protein